MVEESPVRLQTQPSKMPTPREKIELFEDKVSFIAFVAEVVNFSAQTESRSERIKIIISCRKIFGTEEHIC